MNYAVFGIVMNVNTISAKSVAFHVFDLILKWARFWKHAVKHIKLRMKSSQHQQLNHG